MAPLRRSTEPSHTSVVGGGAVPTLAPRLAMVRTREQLIALYEARAAAGRQIRHAGGVLLLEDPRPNGPATGDFTGGPRPPRVRRVVME
jgi:hypothetical protein